MKNKFKFNLRVWLWPGSSPWHFVTLPREFYTEMRQRFPRGMVKVRATVGETSWDTSLFPHTADASFIMPIKKSVRDREGIFERDEIAIKIELI